MYSRGGRTTVTGIIAAVVVAASTLWPSVGRTEIRPTEWNPARAGPHAGTEQEPAIGAGQEPTPKDPAGGGSPAGATREPTTEQKPVAGGEQNPQAGSEQKPGEPQEVPRVDLEVVVTAPRMDVPLKDNPAATTVLPSESLEAMPRAIAAEEPLQMVPGMKVDNQADGERVHISIRGQGLLTERGIRGIKVILDGLPLNDPTGFAPDLFDVDWQAVHRIEVLRGSASALYGGGGSGGVVNITTRDGGAGSPAVTMALTGGSYTFMKGFGEVGGTAGPVNYRFSASANTGDGYRVHTEFHATNIYGKGRFKAGESTTLTAIAAGTVFFNNNAEGLNEAWFTEDLGQGVEPRRQANPDALTYNEYQRTARFTTGVSGRSILTPNQDLTYAVYYRHTGWRESVPSSVQHRTYHTPGFNVQYNLSSDLGSVRNHLSVGTDLDWQGIDEYRHPNLGNAEEGDAFLSKQQINQRGFGFFALDRVDLTPKWGLMAGLRTDRIHNELRDNLKAGEVDLSGTADFAKTTGRVGASWNPRPDFGLYASWGQGFLPPATEELANNPDQLGGFNTHLQPATSSGEEFGVRGAVTNGFSYDVAFFHLDTRNDFGRYRVTSRPLETFYGNLGESRRYGLETSIGYVPMRDLSLQFAYTFNDFLYTKVTNSLFGSFDNVVMPNAPRHQYAVDAQYTFKRHWAIGVSLFGQTMQYIDPTNVPTADGFALLSPRISYRFTGKGHQGEIMFTARNVTGTEYIAFTEPDPDGNSYQPGPTQEFFLGVRFLLGK